MELSLTLEELELLLAVLEERHRELIREISRTRHHEFRDSLRKNEHLLHTIIGKLQAAFAEHAVA